MNRQHVGALMGYMQAAFPNHELDEQQMAVWARHLDAHDERDARVAAQAVVEHEQFFPSIATFVAATQAAARARLEEETAGRRQLAADNSRPLSDDQQLANVARLRAVLAGMGSPAGHDHRGPALCPVCGGIDPRKATPEQLATLEEHRHELNRQRAAG